MAVSANDELIDRWKNEPAPVLALLHAFHDRDGFLSDDVIRAISKGLKVPVADLFGTVTFYHHISRSAPGQQAPRVCTGPACRLKGGLEILEALQSEGATPMACPGRCDDPVPVMRGHALYAGLDAAHLEQRPYPLPVPNPGGFEECVFAHIREPGRATIEGYRKTSGYEGLERALCTMRPAEVIDVIDKSKLTGRGGAGFPTGAKWKAVASAPRAPKFVVCNADEGEPGCFQDRAVLDSDPHAVLEGMIAAAYATGASQGFIYLRYEYPETLRVLERAVAEAEDAGFLGERILGTDLNFRIYIRRGGGAYICGEEGSLLNSLEGKHPFPRNRPPFPVTHGFQNLPTVVNNVETLAVAAHVLRHGPEWYLGLGLGEHVGTKVISVSGDVQRPGNYEVPFGLPLKTLLYDWACGTPEGREIQAVTMAGLSGGFLAGEDLNVTLDEPSIRSKGSFLGAGGIFVFDDSRNMVDVAHNAMLFFAEESCGKCFPCRIGTQRLTERLNGHAGPGELDTWLEEVQDIGQTMQATSACGLGQAAPLITKSLTKYFPEEVRGHVQNRR
ncbi:MAG: NAD(P)H-dependent oxidoreductase subunit E [bacterium]|nr:NAD(P)H-dependent oxidoreductase subunit E [bacterium]